MQRKRSIQRALGTFPALVVYSGRDPEGSILPFSIRLLWTAIRYEAVLRRLDVTPAGIANVAAAAVLEDYISAGLISQTHLTGNA